jgi:hypothetical protein
VGRHNLARGWIGNAENVLELVWLLLTAVLARVRPRQDLVLENLLLRHQLAVLTRPTRTGRRTRPRLWDKLVWILARRWCAGWREHLSFVTPRRWCAGIGRAGFCSGAGSPAPEVAART